MRRREFLKTAGFGAAAVVLGSYSASAGRVTVRRTSANDKLNLGIIGVGGRGAENLKEVATENIVALCDIDEQRLNAAAPKFPGAKLYHDFRRLIDQKEIDAIVVSTPDHTHAVAAVRALRSGRHLYCEKPLAHTISETRIITELARKERRVTQIGTQVHAGNNYRRVVELIQSGAIGRVSDVHVWVNNSWGGKDKSKETMPVPAHLHYNLWLGPAPFIPYHSEHVPYHWRQWWAFGGGTLADFGCHYMDLPFWALGLRTPTTIEAEGPPVHRESTPPWLIVRYEYPANVARASSPASSAGVSPPRANPPLKLTWYHGGRQPDLLSTDLAKQWRSGVLFVGEAGRMLLADYNRRLLLPQEHFKEFAPPPPTIPNSVGHHQEWIQACKTDARTTCSFDYSGPLTEAALLGNVAYRVSQKIEWEAKKMRARNCRAAEEFIHHHYRKGWRI